MRKLSFAFIAALALTSCSLPISNKGADFAYRDGEGESSQISSQTGGQYDGSPFTLEDTLTYNTPFDGMTIEEINADVISSIRSTREEALRQREEDEAAFRQNAIRALSSAAIIGSALFTKNYSSISTDSLQNLGGSVMLMLGFSEGEGFLSSNVRIINALENIQKKLDQISEQVANMEINLVDRINSLSHNLQSATNEILNAVSDAEVRTRFSNSLTFFQAAKSNWDHFVSAQYVPLQNKCNDFMASYVHYFGEFIDKCYASNGIFLTLHYGEDGNITLPRPGIDYDYAGHKVKKDKTVFVPLPEKSFAKLNSLGGSAYNFIDLDILTDLLDKGVDSDLAKDIITHLRLEAARSYFKDFDSIQAYFNAFINFGEALTGLTLDGLDASNMNTIDVYHSLLSAVYNFGFETEDEITGLVAKMARVYYSAASINDMARMFSGTNLYEDRFNLIEKNIVKGLTLEGRRQPNKGAKFFSYDIDSYVEFENHELELVAEFYTQNGREYDDDKDRWCQDENDPKYKETEGSTHVYFDGKEIQLSAIAQKSVAYADFEMMKIKYAHNILPNLETKMSFGDYLMAHGVINDPNKNVIFSLYNINHEDTASDVSGDPLFNLYLTGQKTGNGYEEKLDQFSQINDRNTVQSATKVTVSGRVATFNTEVGTTGNYPLGVGYVYVDGNDRSFRLEGYSAHPEKYYEGNDMSGFITVQGIHNEEPIEYENGASAFRVSDLTDCYVLCKTNI